MLHIDSTTLHKSSVVLCPWALPDGDWPVTLDKLDAANKARLQTLLSRFTFRSVKPEVLSAINRQNAAEQVLNELLEISPGTSLTALQGCEFLEPPFFAVTPVSLHAGRDHVVLARNTPSYLTPLQLSELASAIAPVFMEQGLSLHQTQTPNWYARATTLEAHSQFFSLQTVQSQQALGRNIDAYMAVGDGARAWRQLETQVQMIWFNHPVNDKLALLDLPPINSLWLEGTALAHLPKPAWLESLSSSRPVLQSLARRWQIPHIELNGLHRSAGSLSIIDQWGARTQNDDLAWLHAWIDFSNQFEQLLSTDNCLLVLAGETDLLIGTHQSPSIFNHLISRIGGAKKASKHLLKQCLGW